MRCAALDHAFGDDAPRLRERNDRSRNRLRVRGRSRSSRDAVGVADAEAARRRDGVATWVETVERAAARTSSAVTRPFAPLPCSERMSTLMLASQTPYGRGRAAQLRSHPRPRRSRSAWRRLATARCAGSARRQRPARRCAARFAAAPVSSITAIGVPVATVSPSLTSNSRIVPVTGDGTPALTLSVETSTKSSYLSTLSPTVLEPLRDRTFGYRFAELRHRNRRSH